jgi:PAS domain S-box-containing protein
LARLESISSTFRGLVVQLSPQGVVQYAAGSIARDHGSDWEGRPVFEILPEDQGEALRPILRGVIETGQPVNLNFTGHLTGSVFEGRMGPLREEGEITGAVAMLTDITRRARAEEELREKRTFYKLICGIHADLHFSFEVGPDRQLRINWDAQSIDQLAGYSQREYRDLADWDWRRLAHPEDHERAKLWVNERLSGRQGDPLEWRLVRRSGEVRWMRTWVVQVPGSEPEWIRGIGSTTDITDFKRLDEERARYQDRLEEEVLQRTRELEQANAALQRLQNRLMHAERVRASEHLAGAIAHSINNPLTALIGTVQMRIEQSGQPDPHSDRVLQLARRIRLVVDRTLQLFRAGSLQLTRHRPGEILDAVCAELSDRMQRTGIELKMGVERGLPRLTVDHALLSMALLSICENAIDAMPDGGVLTLEAFRLAGVGVLVLRIEDTGPGIPVELREEVLQPFFTTKGGGTGLGLAIARGVVEGHEGRMRIESAPGGGTRVTLELPIPG